MWVVIIISALFFILLIFVLCAPIVLIIKSVNSEFTISIKPFASFQIIPRQEDVEMQLHIPFYTKKWSLYKMIFEEKLLGSTEGRKINDGTNRSKRKKGNGHFFYLSVRKFWKKFKRILHAFYVMRCNIILDTNDFIFNSWLYPFTGLLNSKDRNIRINYMGVNEIDIKIMTRPVYILWAVLK